jgi:fructoselysine-6-P-deglycase FrlB-like protein
MGTTKTEQDIRSQPACWRAALALAERASRRIAPFLEGPLDLIGCGTSYYMAIAAASYREEMMGRAARACPASEFVPHDGHQVVAITRSGTTTEVLDALRAAQTAGVPSLVLTCVGDSPARELATEALVLDFADEISVVQTRSATSNLLLLRAAMDRDAVRSTSAALPDLLEAALPSYQPVEATRFTHFVYLGSGWSYGVACEAALKLKEASLSITEAYHTMEYRHGPISLAGPQTLVTIFGADEPSGRDSAARVAADVRATGATARLLAEDPLLGLARVQLEAVAIAAARAINPDEPRNLTRSIILR